MGFRVILPKRPTRMVHPLFDLDYLKIGLNQSFHIVLVDVVVAICCFCWVLGFSVEPKSQKPVSIIGDAGILHINLLKSSDFLSSKSMFS